MIKQSDITFFAKTNGRLPHRTFGIKEADRFSHLYIIGKTGTGKTTLIETMAMQDVDRGHGVCVIDPHGDLAERVVAHVPMSRTTDLRYFNVPDRGQPYGYNPVRRVPARYVPLAASGLMEAMKKHWDDAWGVRMEHVLRNALYALIEAGDATLPDILRMLIDREFRKSVAAKVHNEQVRTFWLKEFKAYNPRYRQEMIAPVQNKIGALLADPTLRRIFTAAPTELRFRRLMDAGGILVVNLARGKLGEDSANMLGALLVTTLGLAALSRADVPPEERRPFFVYIDEFQSFTTLSVANMISELRKFGLALTFAHQHLYQLEPEVRHAVLGNVGTLVTFRVGPDDARVIGSELQPVCQPSELMNLANRDVYLKLMIDGAPSQPFSATTLLPKHLQTKVV